VEGIHIPGLDIGLQVRLTPPYFGKTFLIVRTNSRVRWV